MEEKILMGAMGVLKAEELGFRGFKTSTAGLV